MTMEDFLEEKKSNPKTEAIKMALLKFPNTPLLTLAKKIYKDNKALFTNVEAARRLMRYYAGKSGNRDRKRVIDKSMVREKPGKLCPFDAIPEGMKYLSDWKPFHVDGKKSLVLADLHFPFHDKPALITALKYGKSKDVDTIIILGDVFDFFECSFWDREPNRYGGLQKELDIGNGVLDIIRNQFKKAEIIILRGNHDVRLERYLRVKAPELLGLEILKYESLINAEKRGFKIVQDKRRIKIGHLNLIHGHEFGHSVFSPVNPARGLYLRAKTNAMCAHNHQSSQHTEKTLEGDIISTWSIGCLCDRNAEYRPYNNWNHGFAYIERDGKEFIVDSKKIIKGKIY